MGPYRRAAQVEPDPDPHPVGSFDDEAYDVCAPVVVRAAQSCDPPAVFSAPMLRLVALAIALVSLSMLGAIAFHR